MQRWGQAPPEASAVPSPAKLAPPVPQPTAVPSPPQDPHHAVPESAQPAADRAWVDLEHYRVTGYQHRSRLARGLWYIVSLLIFDAGCPVPSRFKRAVLRWFGATIGSGVIIKPHVRIKFPWQLAVGSHTWIGEGTWIDNLAEVRIGSHVCVSQGVYFCTGSHDHRRRGFDLLTAPITVGDGAWLAARSTLLGGVTVGPNALVAAGSLVHRDVPPAAMVGGNPAKFLRQRERTSDAP